MLGRRHARYSSDRYWFSKGSLALGAVLLSVLVPSLGYASNPKETAHTSSVGKPLPKCASTENTPKKNLHTGSAASSETSPQFTDESRIQAPPAGDSMKLESGERDDIQSSEPEYPAGQTGSASTRRPATKSTKDSASQCMREPALKPDLTLDREPAK